LLAWIEADLSPDQQHRKWPLASLGSVAVRNELEMTSSGRQEVAFGVIDCEFGGRSQPASTAVEQ